MKLIILIILLMTPKSNNSNQMEIAINGKIQPQSIEIEQNILCCCINHPTTVNALINTLTPGDYYLVKHQHIYEAILKLNAQSRPVELLTIWNQLKVNSTIDEAGGLGYLTELSQMIPYPQSISYYVEIIKDKSEKRALIQASTTIITSCFEDIKPSQEIITDVDSAMLTLKGKAIHQDYTHQELAHSTVLEMTTPSEGGIKGIPLFGIPDLDYTLNGAEPGDLILLAARPSMGKSMLANTAATHCSSVLGLSTLFWGLEMTAQKNLKMHFANHGNLDYAAVNRGEVNINNASLNRVYSQYQTDKKLINIDRTGVNIAQVRSKILHYHNTVGLDIVIIDHGRLLRKNMLGNYANETQEIELISGILKETAKDLKIPIILLWQLNRNVETRGGIKKPMMSDMRGAGQLEEDADKIILLHRESYYNKSADYDNYDPDHASADIVKNRSGMTKDIDVRFVPQHARFEAYKMPKYDSNQGFSNTRSSEEVPF